MKTVLFLFLIIFCFNANLFAQCTNYSFGQFPGASFGAQCDGMPEIINTGCKAGQYSSVLVTAGYRYEFASNIPTDYLTITDDYYLPLTFGVTPVTFIADFTGEVLFFTHTDAACGESENLRHRIVSCSEIVYCLNASYGLYPSDTYTVPICDGTTDNVISSSCYAGEYSVVQVLSGNTYTFSSSVPTDYLTISDASGSVGYIGGTASVVYKAETDEAIRFYTHTNSNCGEEGANRIRYVRCQTPQGCTIGQQFPNNTYIPGTCDGVTEEIINGNASAGEYAVINCMGVNIYTLGSSVTTDYITVSTEDGLTVLEHGPTPLTFDPAVSGLYRFYIHSDPLCGYEHVNRSRTIICSGSGTPGCNEGMQWPLENYTPEICDGTTQNLVNDDCYAGQYTVIECLGENTYTMSSSVATDYITVTSEDGSITFVSGTTPVTFEPPTDDIYLFYIHKDVFCTLEGVNRSRYVTCSAPLGTEELQLSRWNLYPNPATATVTIASDELISSIEIISIDGKQLLYFIPTALSTELSIEQLKNGTYFVRTTIGGVVQTRELIKQ